MPHPHPEQIIMQSSSDKNTVVQGTPKIVLATLNAKYIHASLGLRYLYANMQDLQPYCEIKEFVIQTRALDIVEKILQDKPDIVGLGVYIWNIVETTDVVNLLKVIAPQVKVILGGPEVSYETDEQAIVEAADYVVTGAGEISLYELCQQILNDNSPTRKVISGKPVALKKLAFPYEFYSDSDLSNRILYVEASRGCPFKCEFCLSSLDSRSSPYELDPFLEQMQMLYDRGARNFKFIDRTFNLDIDTTLKILHFFLDKSDEALYLHFEVIPDHLPRKLKTVLAQFPEGSLQFEIGIQTFNQEVQENISRKQNNPKSKQNLLWLRDHTHAHIHADLIFGLPGESLATFEASFDELYHCKPHEIQLGILKRLRGTPVIRHTDSFDLRFSPLPPFDILSTDRVDFATMQLMNRFARYWDMIGNSGRFKHTLDNILSEAPFAHFMALTHWLYDATEQTHKISLKRLFELLSQAIMALFPDKHATALPLLAQDYEATQLKSLFNTLNLYGEQQKAPRASKLLHRQKQHMQSQSG